MTTDGLIAQPEPWHKGPRRDSSADGITECLRWNIRLPEQVDNADVAKMLLAATCRGKACCNVSQQ